MDEELYGRTVLEELDEEARIERLHELEKMLLQRLAKKDSDSFFDDTNKIIESLRSIGHDLWSWDYDGETELWGGNYQKPELCGKLIIKFNPSFKVKVEWGNENWKE